MTAEIKSYIESQIAIWGDEYVDNLIDSGYVPTKTTAGWRWVYVPADSFADTVNDLFADSELVTNG